MLNYIAYFDELIKSGSLFWFCALAGSGMFFIQFVINILGVGDHDSLDAGEAFTDDGHSHTDARRFKWLSMQTLTGFLMMFGWTAITCQYEFDLQNSTTIGISLAAGIFAALIIRSIFKLAKRLMSQGSIFRIEDAIGKEAYVYHRIPKDGVGKISMTLQHFTHEIDAITDHPEDLPSFMRVKIVQINDDNTVVVKPL